MMELLALFIIRRRLYIAIALIAITGFLLYNAVQLPVKTYFPDLLPQDHQFIKLIKKHPKFGATNNVIIGLEAKDGTIWNHDTLQDLIDLSHQCRFIPGVDKTKIISLGVEKVRNAKITACGIFSPPILFPEAPKTKQGIEDLKADVYSNPTYAGRLVSQDGKMALIRLGFFEKELQPRIVYQKIQDFKNKFEDKETELHVVGEPYLYGVLFSYLPQTGFLFGVTVIAMMIVAFLYTRSLRLTFLPLLSATVCAIWGLGFMELMGYNLDPLILVLPLLISATALSHSIQFNWRFNLEYAENKDLRESCYNTIKGLFPPGVASIITDATGIVLIALIPIPLMTQVGLSLCIWCISMIFGILLLNPILNLYLPKMKNVDIWRDKRKKGLIESFILPLIASLSAKKSRCWVIVIVFAVVAIVAFQLNQNIIVGNLKEGTPILKQDSTYNKDVQELGETLPGMMNPMMIIFEGQEEGVIKQPEVISLSEKFQTHMARLKEVTQSEFIGDLIKGINMAFYENNPNFYLLPDTRRHIYSCIHLLTSGGADPGDFATYYDYYLQDLNIKLYCRDHLPSTINKLLSEARSFISEHNTEFGEFKIAGGRVGVIAANNQSIFDYLSTTLIAALVLTGIFVGIIFRSFIAGILLVIPIALASWFTFGFMSIQEIGINLQTLPVSIIAIGIGIDYGVYLLSRIKEHYRLKSDWSESIREGLYTAGSAIIITGAIIIVGVVFWVFSDINFQARMGLLFAIVTFFHVLGALILLPAMVKLIKPKFLTR